jgi:hypothetical protein
MQQESTVPRSEKAVSLSPHQQETDGNGAGRAKTGKGGWRNAARGAAQSFVGGCAGLCTSVVDYKLRNTFLGGAHLPPGAVGVLLALVLVVNPLLRLLSRHKNGFSRNEALTVYTTCLFSSLVPGHGSENFLVPNLLAPFYFATRENKWLEWLSPYLKPWLTPSLNADGTVNDVVVSVGSWASARARAFRGARGWCPSCSGSALCWCLM